METFSTILALLMIFSTSAASGSSLCELKGIYRKENSVINVEEMTEGCWTNFAINETDVHILNLRFTSVNSDPQYMAVTTVAPSILIFNSPVAISRVIYLALNSNFDTKIYASKGTSVVMVGKRKPEVHSSPGGQGSELVSWATEQFGGVSSFTTIHDPVNIIFNGLKGTESVCQLKLEVPAKKTEPKFQSNDNAVTSCLLDSPDKIHIINIPDNVNVRNVSVDVVSSGIKLVLRGPAGTVWKVNSQTASILSNNVVHLSGLTMNWPKTLSDGDTELQNQTLRHFKSKSFSGYTKILLNSPVIVIRIEESEHNEVTGEYEVKTTESPESYTRMRLFTSPDYLMELNPTTKVQTDKRLYAQVVSLVHGNLVLMIKVTSCFVRSKDMQPVERTVSFNKEPCSECRNNIRFSFSFDNLQDQPSNTWELQCNISHCLPQILQGCAEPQVVKKDVLVTPSHVKPGNKCIEFSLQSVLGVAFGGFLIGVLLMGALWFIKIRTGYPLALGFSSTGTFFSGCPCGLIKRHAVPTNPSPSENSSANGSMSSTQSTPTSSMA